MIDQHARAAGARRRRFSAALLTAVASATSAVLFVAGIAHGAGATARPDAVPNSGSPSASPLLFGENLDLYPGTTGSDWFLSRPALRAGLVNAHVQTIRMPVRGPSPSSSGIANLPELKAALQDVAAMGLTPLIILRNPQDPTLLADDTEAVDYVNTLFTNQPVYYEWANETDDTNSPSHVSAAAYLASWNADVPKLKAIANPGALFVGPVNFQYDSSYLQTFLAGANPVPDAISWHEYTCDDSKASEADCEAKISNWSAHASAARTLMTNILGRELPIWITEWNYTPVIDGADSKHSDTAFLEQWTTLATQALAADGTAGSMHYNVNNLNVSGGSLPLVRLDGTLAPEGVSFSAAYTSLVGSGSPPPTSSSPSTTPSSSPSTPPSSSSPSTPPSSPPSSTSASSTPPGGTAPRYSFEDGGLDGWSSTGDVTALADSTAVGGQDGTHALRVDLYSASSSDEPYVHVNPSGGGPSAGQSVTAWVYRPTGDSTTLSAKLYVQDSAFRWHIADATVVSSSGAWQELSFTPAGYSGSALQLGVQFQVTPVNTGTTVYLDSVDWS